MSFKHEWKKAYLLSWATSSSLSIVRRFLGWVKATNKLTRKKKMMRKRISVLWSNRLLYSHIIYWKIVANTLFEFLCCNNGFFQKFACRKNQNMRIVNFCLFVCCLLFVLWCFFQINFKFRGGARDVRKRILYLWTKTSKTEKNIVFQFI